MTKTLKQEFASLNRRPWKVAAALAGVAVFGIGAAVLWPTPTLRAAAVRVETLALVPPYRDGRNVWSQTNKWHWVDATRRAEMIGPQGHNTPCVDAALKLAGGRPYMAMVIPCQALIATKSGPVLLFEIFSGDPAGLARDARGGPVLDLAPFKIGGRFAAVPVDKLLDLVTPEPGREKDVDWRVYLTRPPGSFNDFMRQPIPIKDPLVALRFGREARP